MLRYRSLFPPIAAAAVLAVVTAGTTLGGGIGAAAAPAGANAAAVGTLAATAGCGKAPGIASGTHTISSNGKNRTFILRIPSTYNQNNPYRLVIGFHWLGGTAVDVDTGQTVDRNNWSYYGLQRLANNSTIFVAPQGLNNGWANSGGEDITLVDNILSRLDAALCIDTSQRFALGFSYGAAMSYAVACARANVFRAVAVYAVGQLSGCSGGTQPIAYFAAHGIRDGVLNISGGRSMRNRFVTNNGCTSQNPPEPTQGSLRHITTAYSGCRAGYPVVWAAFDEGHIAAPQDGATGDSGTRTWLPGETWNFFTQFQSSPNPTTPPVNPTTPPVNPTTPPVNPTTPPVNPTTPPAGAGCTASVSLNSWTGGFVASVRVTAGSAGTRGWTVSMTLPGGASVTNTWSATASGSTGTVRFTNVDYNGQLSPGQVTEFGFQGNGSGSGMTPTCTAS